MASTDVATGSPRGLILRPGDYAGAVARAFCACCAVSCAY
jgi:hypothetical protein